MYKVFFKDRSVFLGDKLESLNFKGMVYGWSEGDSLEGLLFEFEENTELTSFFIAADQSELLFESFRKCFTYIEAAGGKVFNSDGDILGIFRLGKWDLPKGKVEKGESIRDAAIREVEEECGISGLTIVKELNSTYHTYSLKGKQILKQTHWFEMSYSGSETLVPQTEEDIQLVKWLPIEDLSEFQANTYASILDVLNENS